VASLAVEANENDGEGLGAIIHSTYQDPVLCEAGYYVLPPVKWVIHFDASHKCLICTPRQVAFMIPYPTHGQPSNTFEMPITQFLSIADDLADLEKMWVLFIMVTSMWYIL